MLKGVGITSHRDLEGHPKVGAFWEVCAIEEILKALRPDEVYISAPYTAVRSLICCCSKKGRRIRIECKRADAPTLTPSTLFGLIAVTAMLTFYSLEETAPVFTMCFAASCLMGSAYGFLQGAWPFGIVEGIWGLVALRKWSRLRHLRKKSSENST